MQNTQVNIMMPKDTRGRGKVLKLPKGVCQLGEAYLGNSWQRRTEGAQGPSYCVWGSLVSDCEQIDLYNTDFSLYSLNTQSSTSVDQETVIGQLYLIGMRPLANPNWLTSQKSLHHEISHLFTTRLWGRSCIRCDLLWVPLWVTTSVI